MGVMSDAPFLTPSQELTILLLMDTIIRALAFWSFLALWLLIATIFVKFFRLGRETQDLWQPGLILAGTIFCTTALLSILAGRQSASPGIILGVAFVSLRSTGLAIVGVYLSRLLGFPSFPLLSSLFHETTSQLALKVRSRVLPTILVVISLVLITTIFFRLTNPKMMVPIATISLPGVLLFALLIPLEEEVLFRLGIQTYLTYFFSGRDTLAILLTSVLFSLQHIGLLEPEWVKVSQTFLIGIALGWLYRMRGFESSYCAHALFNGAAVVLQYTQLLNLR